MARRPLSVVSSPPTEASSVLGGFLSSQPEKISGGRRGEKISTLSAAISKAEARARSGEWGDALPPVFVGLYAVCHRLVFGVLPLELEEQAQFRLASKLALGCLHDYFDDDGDAFASFVRWAWKREEGRARYAREQGWDRKRMGWRLLFSAHTVTDYRASTAGAR